MSKKARERKKHRRYGFLRLKDLWEFLNVMRSGPCGEIVSVEYHAPKLTPHKAKAKRVQERRNEQAEQG